MTIWNELLGNQVLISAVLGGTVAQFLKTVIDMVLNRSFNPLLHDEDIISPPFDYFTPFLHIRGNLNIA